MGCRPIESPRDHELGNDREGCRRMSLSSDTVFCVRAPSPDYDGSTEVDWPELPDLTRAPTSLVALRRLLENARLDEARLGTRDWNPLGDIVAHGDRVLIKPNWVRHANKSGRGIDCLVTHPSVIEAVLLYLEKARPAEVVIGDAPLQGCEFPKLRELQRLDDLPPRFAPGMEVEIRDFRLTILHRDALRSESRRSERRNDQYIRFDLGAESELEEISDAAGRFRVTMYNPEPMSRMHAPGKHQYVIAREMVDADVVFNLPKLKTHERAGITGALKNFVGINGHKDCLPHHRKGGSRSEGDCYEGGSVFKGLLEDLLDRANRADRFFIKRGLKTAVGAGLRLARTFGDDGNLRGAWYGNDTVWRMCLDLQRILHYGTAEAEIAARLQRRVVTITDAIIAGEGEGPLSPLPIPLGVMTLSTNAPAADWVHAYLMGMDPLRIPLLREAFSVSPRPLSSCTSEQVVVNLDGERVRFERLPEMIGKSFRPPSGWIGHCELDPDQH